MIRFGKGLDLSRDFVEALVEMTQVAAQLGDHLDHARREKCPLGLPLFPR